MDVGSREYIFAIKLMTSVMKLYRIKWKPKKTPFYVKLSPFTPAVKKAVEYIWREKNEFIDDLFNTVLAMGTINMRNYKAAVEFASHLVTEAEYDEIELLRYCVIASGYASLFYRNGLKDVPNQCIQLIYDVIMTFRTKNQFTDQSWADIEILGEAYSGESPFKEDFSNATSACLSQLSENDCSDSFLHVEIYPRNVEEKYASKTIHHKIKNQIQTGDRSDAETYNGRSTKSETKQSSLKLSKHKNATEKTKKIKKTIANREDADERVAEQRVKKIGSTKIATTILAKTKHVRDEIVASKYVTAKVEDDNKPNAEEQCKSLKVEHAKFKHKKITAKFRDYKAVETINAFVMSNKAVKGSEASNYMEKESEKINKASKKFNQDKYNKIESETENMGENIVYETKKINRIKQESDGVPKTYKANEVADVEETSNRTEITKTKKLKKHKRRKSKNKALKAQKSILHGFAYKGIDTNFTLQECEEIEYPCEGISKTNCTEVEGAVVLKDTDKRKSKKDKLTKHETNIDMFKTAQSVIPPSKEISKNVHESNKVALNTAVIIDTKKKSKYNNKISGIVYLTEEMKDVEQGAQISENKLTVKDVQRTKYDKSEVAKDNLKTFSDTKDKSQEFGSDGKNAENAAKNKLVKYKTKKFKGKRYRNKKVQRRTHEVKESERTVRSLGCFVPSNQVSGHLVDVTKYAAGKTSKKVELNKKKIRNKKAKAKKHKEVTEEAIPTSDEYVDVETIDEDVVSVSENVVSKKRKHNTKSVKKTNIDTTPTRECPRPRRRSTRENIANPLVIDLTKENRVLSNEFEPAWKDPNIRNPGCEISNLINVSANESSMSIFRHKSQENASSGVRNQESENKDPICTSKPIGFEEVPLEMAKSSETSNITHLRKSISGAETKQDNVTRKTTHSRHKSY